MAGQQLAAGNAMQEINALHGNTCIKGMGKIKGSQDNDCMEI